MNGGIYRNLGIDVNPKEDWVKKYNNQIFEHNTAGRDLRHPARVLPTGEIQFINGVVIVDSDILVDGALPRDFKYVSNTPNVSEVIIDCPEFRSFEGFPDIVKTSTMHLRRNSLSDAYGLGNLKKISILYINNPMAAEPLRELAPAASSWNFRVSNTPMKNYLVGLLSQLDFCQADRIEVSGFDATRLDPNDMVDSILKAGISRNHTTTVNLLDSPMKKFRPLKNKNKGSYIDLYITPEYKIGNEEQAREFVNGINGIWVDTLVGINIVGPGMFSSESLTDVMMDEIKKNHGSTPVITLKI